MVAPFPTKKRAHGSENRAGQPRHRQPHRRAGLAGWPVAVVQGEVRQRQIPIAAQRRLAAGEGEVGSGGRRRSPGELGGGGCGLLDDVVVVKTAHTCEVCLGTNENIL